MDASPFGLTDSGEGFGGFGVEEKKEEAPSGGFGGFGVEEKKEEVPSGGFTLGEAKPSEEPSLASLRKADSASRKRKKKRRQRPFTFGEAKPSEEPSLAKAKKADSDLNSRLRRKSRAKASRKRPSCFDRRSVRLRRSKTGCQGRGRGSG